MNQSLSESNSFFKSACLFELALLPVAIILGWILSVDPFFSLNFSEWALLVGIVGTIPLILLFFSLQRARSEALRIIRDLIMETLARRMHDRHWTDLLILSLIAGIAEEVLFRGVLQVWMEMKWGLWPSLLLSGLLFGLAHAVTPLYAVLSAVVSIYLGLALDYGGTRNLLTPIVIHGLYDFVALLLIVRSYKQRI